MRQWNTFHSPHSFNSHFIVPLSSPSPQQVDEWYPELIEIEEQAKSDASLLLFVVDNQTRAVSSMVEIAYFAGKLYYDNNGMMCIYNSWNLFLVNFIVILLYGRRLLYSVFWEGGRCWNVPMLTDRGFPSSACICIYIHILKSSPLVIYIYISLSVVHH